MFLLPIGWNDPSVFFCCCFIHSYDCFKYSTSQKRRWRMLRFFLSSSALPVSALPFWPTSSLLWPTSCTSTLTFRLYPPAVPVSTRPAAFSLKLTHTHTLWIGWSQWLTLSSVCGWCRRRLCPWHGAIVFTLLLEGDIKVSGRPCGGTRCTHWGEKNLLSYRLFH